jgi:biotin transport system substrate-specific component
MGMVPTLGADLAGRLPMNTTSPSLAVHLWPSAGSRVVRNIALLVLGCALLWVSAKVKVPFWPVPMTLQTFAVMAIAAAYGARLGVATVIAYLAAGMAGLPVFTNTPPEMAGPAYLLGPTGGFLIGFIAAAFIVGYAADRGWDRSVPKLLVAMVTADAVVFALGLAWLGVAVPALGYSWGLIEAGLFPFLLGDLLKVLIAALAIPAAWRLLA